MIKGVYRMFKNPSKLKQIPRILGDIYAGLMCARTIRANHKQFLKSGKAAINGDLPYNREKVLREFQNRSIEVIPYTIKIASYEDYIARAHYPVGSYGSYFTEKSLEHFLSFQFSDLDEHSLVLDVANAYSPFPRIIHDLFQCRVISNDLAFPKGTIQREHWHTQIGCNACHLPVQDESVDLMTLHCALEMFEGDDDINLVREASRVLKKGGKMMIVPLYMNEVYHILRDPKNSRRIQPPIDYGAELVYRLDFHNVAFARFYNVDALFSRLLVNKCGLSFSVYKIQNTKSLDPNVYAYWMGVFEKV